MGSNKAVVVRMYEVFGSQTSIILKSQLPFKAYQRWASLPGCNACLHANIIMCIYTHDIVFLGAIYWRKVQGQWRIGLVNSVLISNHSNL